MDESPRQSDGEPGADSFDTRARRELLDQLAQRLPVAVEDSCVLVGIDGPDGSGKTFFADELAAAVRTFGRPAVRISEDDFHHVRAIRYRRGRNSPLGFYLDSYNDERLISDVFTPLAAGGDRRYRPIAHDLETDEVLDPEWITAPAGCVVIVDGLFLHRPKLANLWSYSVYLDVPPQVTAARMAVRNGSDASPGQSGVRRYFDAQLIYLGRCTPRAMASVTVDNTDLAAPREVGPAGYSRSAHGRTGGPDESARIRLSAGDLAGERPCAADDDVHFPEALASFVIETFTRSGDRILDPFAGYGTTLVLAERLGRTAIGVELLPDRVAMIRRRVADPSRILEGDARALGDLDLGNFDLCLTSPPYMNAFDHPENPLTGYRTTDGSYLIYLTQMRDIFAAIAAHLRPGGVLVLNAANIRSGDSITPLAEDLTAAAQQSFRLVDTIGIKWDIDPPLVADDRLMIFTPGQR